MLQMEIYFCDFLPWEEQQSTQKADHQNSLNLGTHLTGMYSEPLCTCQLATTLGNRIKQTQHIIMSSQSLHISIQANRKKKHQIGKFKVCRKINLEKNKQ